MNYKSHIGLIITVSFLDMINRNILDTNSSEVPKGSLIKKDKIETFVLEGSNINEILKPHEKPFQEALDKSELKMGKYSRNLAKG
jgi:hypothetical protein